MKKLLLLVLIGTLSLVSCKKTVQPSAITADTAVAKVTIQGTVSFKFQGGSTAPASGDFTVVTATGTDSNTFSVRPDQSGNFVLQIPVHYNASTSSFDLKATVKTPSLGTYEGSTSVSSIAKNGTKTGVSIICSLKEE